MTSVPYAARLPDEDQTYFSRPSNNSSLSPPIQHPGGRNNTANISHRKQPSVTSNPASDAIDPVHQHVFAPVYSYGDFSQPHAIAPEHMGTYTSEHEFDSTAHQGFSFDELMTPEYSDNQISEHTTPQELIWEQQFLPHDSTHPDIVPSSEVGSPNNPQSPSNEFRGLLSSLSQEPPKAVRRSQLLSPRLTTASPSIPPSALGASDGASSDMRFSGRKRGAEPLQVATDPSTLAPQVDSSASHRKPVSPSVIITSVSRGDSPARLGFARARSSSKRGRESGLQHSSDHDEHSSASRSPRLSPIDHSASRLMPPDAFDSEVYNNNDQERAGVDPGQRGNQHVSTINELADQRQMDQKNAEVEDWLSKSETGSAVDESESAPRSIRGRPDRPRAHSTGIPLDAMGLPIYSDRNIPGPGVLIDEDSQDEYTDDGSESITGSERSRPESPPISQEKLNDEATSYFSALEDESIPPEQQEPLPKQFFRRTPWQDPFRGPITNDTRDQPASSNAAAMRFNQEAAKWETASRAATWGTRRRLSESEVSSIVDGSRVRHLSLAKRGRERGNTLLNKARGLIPRRSNSNIKKGSESPPKAKTPEIEGPSRRDTGGSMKPISRISSFGKPKPLKSPPLDTGSALMAMTGNLAAVGQGSTSAIDTSFIKSEGLKSPLQMLRKVRSKSDVGRSPSKSSPGLADLLKLQGGPPMPTLASPAQHHQPMPLWLHTEPAGFDDDDDDMLDDAGIKMDFKIRAENIIPNYEGFKIHARQLNPRLEPYLIDRVGQEQVRRYKKLIDLKIKHTKAVQIAHKCPSGKYCVGLGGEAILLPPRVSSKDPDATCAQFQVTSHADEDVEETSFEEGVVTPALFPPGIPLPPAKRLPAEFECILCFKVKKFQKPSDWTKHVHEDIQPFSCTFPHCNEPKSFKRKADWVRHENERHRRLEYWKCNVQECSHICYRKDNFVQHLVREHKKTEPKVKSRGSGSSKNKPVQGNDWVEDNELWHLVDICRSETASKPRDEPCRFCGNICNSWKKLSVHMGKHMEQIAMPVLELVNMREVAPDTIISPIEQNYQQNAAASTSNMPTVMSNMDHQLSVSPYSHSANSFHTPSAGQSPAVVHSHMRPGYDQYYGSHGMSTPTHVLQNEAYPTTSMYSASASYATGEMPGLNQYGSINTQLGPSYPTPTIQTPLSVQPMHSNIPRSEPLTNGYRGNTVAATSNAAYPSQHMTYTSSPEMTPYHQYSTVTHQGQGFEDSDQVNTNHHYSEQGYMYDVHQGGQNHQNYEYR